MIKEHILNRMEILTEDYSAEQNGLWAGEVVDYRNNPELSPFAQELFDVHRRYIAPIYLSAKTYTRASEFSFVLEAKMSNNDRILSTYFTIYNNIHRDRNLEHLGKFKIVINGEEVNDYMGWTTSSLSNFASLRSFYFENWIPSQQDNF